LRRNYDRVHTNQRKVDRSQRRWIISKIKGFAVTTTVKQRKNSDNLKPYKPGQSGNPKGRPKIAIAEQFRNNPKAKEVLDKIITVANTLNTENEHKDAITCARIVADKIIPTLKAQEIHAELEQKTGRVIVE